MTLILIDVDVVADEGSVVVMSGEDERTGVRYNFAADWRHALAIISNDIDRVAVEPWQLLGVAAPRVPSGDVVLIVEGYPVGRGFDA